MELRRGMIIFSRFFWLKYTCFALPEISLVVQRSFAKQFRENIRTADKVFTDFNWNMCLLNQ